MRLRIGDRILKVNGRDVSKASHHEAVQALVEPTPELILTVQHDPPPRGLQELTIHRAENEKLGMNIKGGLRGHPGNPLDKSDEGVFISKINSGGAAKRDGRLKVHFTIDDPLCFDLITIFYGLFHSRWACVCSRSTVQVCWERHIKSP